jgi:hypothetical protein
MLNGVLGFGSLSGMYCPSCKDEFRAGFTRCESCGVDLVEDLSQVAPKAEPLPKLPPDGPIRVADYCGFFSLDEARHSRDVLREKDIRSEIAIRDAPAMPGDPVEEEYWLRVEATQMKAARALLDTVTTAPGEEILCGNCDKPVGADEAACPHCDEKFHA